jgi:hypothetical protein
MVRRKKGFSITMFITREGVMKGMDGLWARRFFQVLVVFAAIVASGCETAKTIHESALSPFKSIAGSLGGASSRHARTVVFTPIQNRTSLSEQEVVRLFLNPLVERYRNNCASSNILLPESSRYPKDLSALPRLESGELDNFSLSKIGLSESVNAIATVDLISMEVYSEEQGVLWFKDTRHFLQLHLRIQVFDTATAAKLLDERFLHDEEIDEDQYRSEKQSMPQDLSFLYGRWEDLSATLGENVCNAIKEQPWAAQVVEVSEGTVHLSSGKQAGINPGDRFTVFQKSIPMEGVGGHRFLLPGKEIGEIEILTVFDNSAEGVIRSGNSVEPGCLVKEKP